MTLHTHMYTSKNTDLQGGITRSTQSLNESGSWFFKQVATYTELSPLTVIDGTTVKLVIPENDIGFSQSILFDLSYDYSLQRFMPTTDGDIYIASLRGKVIPTAQAGYVETIISSPGASFNPVDAATLTFTKSGGEEQFLSQSFLIFISQDLVDNGLEIFAKPINTNIDIYDYSFTIARIFSNKGSNQ